jgi:hypothetical protein
MDRARRRIRNLGFVLIGAAGVLGLAALQHMRAAAAMGYICGGAAPHCPACPAAVAALVLGTCLLAAGLQPRRRRVRVDD